MEIKKEEKNAGMAKIDSKCKNEVIEGSGKPEDID